MSINSPNGKEIIKMSWIWEVSFKLWLLSVPFVLTAIFAWTTWATVKIFDLEREIAVIKASRAPVAATETQPNYVASSP